MMKSLHPQAQISQKLRIDVNEIEVIVTTKKLFVCDEKKGVF